ncbi:TMEM175 family protein [Brevundimonas sp.]|uniref:TMEM175 family protein n=1 Tax=Brevundimonas sp. TaxID=1871086 RepID=UPI0039190998
MAAASPALLDRDQGARRLDGFVDAAFAFAVTLLVVAGSPPSTLDELGAALGRAPSVIASFAIICIFWLGYRDVGRLAPRRDALSTVLSLAIVLLVLIYVFPLRLMFESAFHLMSGRLLPGRDLATDVGDFRFLFTAYGAGFVLLSGAYATLYGHHIRLGGDHGMSPVAREEARDWMVCWLIMVAVAVLSILLALLAPAPVAVWAPGVIYLLIPILIALRHRLLALVSRRVPTAGTVT